MLACSKLYSEIVGGPKIEPKPWSPALENFEHRSELSIETNLNLWFCPKAKKQIDGETKETVSDFILGGSKITADVDCSHEIKRHSLLGRKV